MPFTGTQLTAYVAVISARFVASERGHQSDACPFRQGNGRLMSVECATSYGPETTLTIILTD
jgi:hypothetical protein